MPAGFPVLSMCPVQAGDGSTMKLYQEVAEEESREEAVWAPPHQTQLTLEQHRRLNGMGSATYRFSFLMKHTGNFLWRFETILKTQMNDVAQKYQKNSATVK